jgi:hypothetical protein
MMDRKGSVSPHPPKEIVSKIRDIIVELERALENDGLTTPQLIKLIHGQTLQLARIFHRLSHLHSGKGGNH